MTSLSPHGAFAAPQPRARVAVAMSGGVDSSVAAALLVEQGHDVVGVHLKLNAAAAADKRPRSCCSLDDSLDARAVCARLGIPFYVIDFTAAFQRQVIDYFVASYRRGLTPNPCVMCNRTVKTAQLLEKVREFGCDRLATGHYAAIRADAETGAPALVRPADRRKDQTYFLWGTAREHLPHLLFPLAGYGKDEVRAQAGRHGFRSWNKPDSQEVCFVPGDYRALLRPRLEGAQGQPAPGAGGTLPGAFVDAGGRVLGEHGGLAFYTIGQRRGLGIGGGEPLYVVALRPAANEVVLGPAAALFGDTLTLGGVNWVSCAPPAGPIEATVKVRYAHAGTAARLTPLAGGRWRADFAEPVRAITPGQAAAFYRGEVLLGGGWIEAGGTAAGGMAARG
ncbi:MAG: tRNA 2-thiouridine(34) synthase MnmA [Candidatus Lambdaproteobacteria bacterium]|nr:tRNA 2-thiouridine(34) synthase MnmA [Candidatus Lambdaproteobacteria bacterium]